MSYRLKAYFFSLLLHLSVVAIFILLPTGGLRSLKKPIEIDLSSLELERPTREEHQEWKITKISKSKVQDAKLPLRTSSPTHTKAEALEKNLAGETHKQGEESSKEDVSDGQSGYAIAQGIGRGSEGLPQGHAVHPNSSKEQSEAVGFSKPNSTSAEAQRETYLKEKLFVISQIIQRNIRYPVIAQRMGWEGKVLLAIRLGEDGSLKEVKVLESSGHEVLDKNAVETVKRVANLFPKPPVEVIVKLPVRYELE